MHNAGDLFNDLYYIYNDKYNEEINSLNTKNRKKFDYKKLRLTDDYQYLSEEEQEETSEKSTKTDMNEFSKYIAEEETDINEELFKKHFSNQMPYEMLKHLHDLNDKMKNNLLVKTIKSGLIDLKNEIKKMSEDEIKIEKPYEIVDIVEKILEFNKQNQEGQGLKILTPSQMLSRLPISLTQLNAGNNSEKLKNEIRQLLYSLHRSKKLTTQIYKSLIDII